MRAGRGRGWFTGGALGMIAIGLMHLSAHLRPPPPGSEAALDAMAAFTVTALGLTWSIRDAYGVLSLSFAALSISVGVLDLYVARALRPTGPALAGLALLNALVAAALVAIAAAGRVAPPLYLYAVAAAVSAVSALRSRVAEPSAP